MTKIVGIVNLTRDSFSDGGVFVKPARAIAHALTLVRDGADIVDLGPESTHPDSEDVPADEQIARLRPVMTALANEGVTISVDASLPAVVSAALEMGAAYINDVTGLANDATIDVVAKSDCHLVVMHSISEQARAERKESDATTIVARILAFFEERVQRLEAAGVARERIILDPGLGFFIGTDPRVSFAVLKRLDALRGFGLPLLIGASRKSFIGAVLGDGARRVRIGAGETPVPPEAAKPRPVDQRGSGTLAVEIHAANCGVEYIRTHDVRALRDALTVLRSIRDV